MMLGAVMNETEQHDLPSGWTWAKLGNLAAKLRAGGTPSTKRAEFYEGGNIPFAKVEDVVDAGKYLRSTYLHITSAGIENSSTWLVPKGALLYTMYASYGVPTITEIEVATNQAIIAFLPKQELVHLDFIYYYLWSIKPELAKQTKGTTQANLNKGIVENLEVPLPPLTQQRRIVEKIEELFTKLDAGVDALKKTQVLLKKYRQAVLKAAVTGELSREWREQNPDVEPVSELLERVGSSRNEQQLTQNELDDLPLLPRKWIWRRLGEITDIKGGLTVNKSRVDSTSREVPYLRVANVQRGFLDLTEVKAIWAPEEKIAQLKLQKGDVLFTEGGDRDKLGRGWVWNDELDECIHQNHIFRARLKEQSFEGKFVSWFGNTFGQDYFMKQGKQTTNLASINLTKLRAFPVPLPPVEEQKLIISRVEEILSVIDKLAEVTVHELNRAERLRQSILKQAFSGKLVPQNPEDEPASVLLERIKSGKEESKKPREWGEPRSGAEPARQEGLFD